MKTNSWSFPNIFNTAQNQVAILEDDDSITNRVKNLMLTEPTEVYNEPPQGVGIKRYLWQYNTPNLKQMLIDRLKEQLRLYEPYANPEGVQWVSGNLFTGSSDSQVAQSFNKLEMTISVETSFGSTVSIIFENLQEMILNGE